MNLLVMHQIYANGVAFDLSGFRNHGTPYFVTQAPPPYAPSFTYAYPESRVVVAPSSSLQDLLAIRAIVVFNLNPAGGITQRYNLMEGHVSFALYVNPDGSLSATIVDAGNVWAGAQTGPNLISTNRWYVAEMRHDGVNQCSILLDGFPVATSYAATGPVRSVGPNGIAIGHWPEPSGQYTFGGFIRETWLYKYDPALAAKNLIDPCCKEYRAGLDEAAAQLRATGYTAEQARAQGMALIKFGLSISAQVRGTNPVRSQEQAALAAMALAAFERNDSAGYTFAITQLATMAARTLSPATMKQIHAEEEALFKALPLPLKTWQSLIGKMCWGAKLDPKAVLTGVQNAPKPPANPPTTEVP
jgi:Concanavalin A-like lectin/glucanases superfamily